MNFNIYLDDQLGAELTEAAKVNKKSRNALIRDAVALWLKTHKNSQWPDDVLAFEGIPDFPAFEAQRDDLGSPKDDPFA
uniref:Ribbon-helix-helix protein CopG domain-containing protein n=1 Tax=uncultured Thiotrichaceae bacterium TaxID=298394 RepID=A0A6S6UNS9_9GAMM|nr:MAG: Unknown protein [uncultured Thiotrichaceae bacterium]